MNLAYPLKHWLTSLSIGPLMMIIYDAFSSSKLMNDAFVTCLLFVTFGLFFSLPVFILYVLVYNRIIKTDQSNLTIKIILNIIGVIGVVTTFSVIKGSITMVASICYSIALITGSIFYKVRPVS